MVRRRRRDHGIEGVRHLLTTLGLPRLTRAEYVARHPFQFMLRVLSGFRENQVLLLAGAVAYNTLLSLIPMLALMLVALSQLMAPDMLLAATRDTLTAVAPGLADTLTAELRTFIGNWRVIGVVGVLALVFFSSLAFTSLENAMSVIFFHRVAVRRRHFLVSAVIPYLYILLLTIGLLAVTTLSSTLHALEGRSISIFGTAWSLSGTGGWVMYAVGVVGEVLLLTSLYLVMPVGRLALRHALIGGITATVLWELTRHFLVWYFSNLSIVNLVYGTFAAAIMILLSLELAALILLFGAQVIAEYERIRPSSGR
jgi:YihY family inner membrane protein